MHKFTFIYNFLITVLFLGVVEYNNLLPNVAGPFVSKPSPSSISFYLHSLLGFEHTLWEDPDLEKVQYK